MADQNESPQIADATAKVEVAPTDIADPIQAGEALLAELKGIGVTEPDQLHNMAKASSETGRLANMLGEERQRARDLEMRLAAAEAKARREPAPTDFSFEAPTQAKPMTEQDLDNWWDRKSKQVWEAQQAQNRQWMAVTSDPDYNVPQVRAVWEEHIKNPEVGLMIQLGQTTPATEFGKVSKAVYRKLLVRSTGTMKQILEKGKPGSSAIPHVESGSQAGARGLPAEQDERQEKIKKLREAPYKEGNLDAMIDALLPSDDPWFKP